jgi:hypothetical protein
LIIGGLDSNSDKNYCNYLKGLLFLGQNEIHPDLMSWPLIRVLVHFNLSLNIFSETTTPRGLTFCRNVPWVVLFKICSFGSRIPNNFQTGSKKLPKIA